MPTPPLRARHTRADGTPVLCIEVPHEFDHDEAALALAIVYADQPLRKSVQAVREGLNRAVEQHVLDAPPAVPDQAVRAYRDQLRELMSFPDEVTRQKMLEDLRDAQQDHRLADPRSRPTAPSVGQPAIWAKHTRERDGHPVVRIEHRRYFDLEQAADALAIVYTARPVPLRSSNALRLGLQEAGRADVLADDARQPHAALADQYRSILVDQGVFSAGA